MRALCPLAIAIAICLSGAAAAADGRWSSGMGQGFRAHAVSNGPAANFRIVCDVGYSERAGTETHVLTTIRGKRPPPKSTVTVRIDGQEIVMDADGKGLIPTSCPECARAFEEIWVAIRKGQSMTVRFADGRESRFSLRGSAKSLDPEPCPTAARPAQQTTLAQSSSQSAEPERILQAAYRQVKAGEIPKDPPAWFSDEFLRVLRKERRCEAKLDDQRYAGMLWFSGQDWEISDLRISVGEQSERRQTLMARFKNFGKLQVRTFDFAKTGSNWRIDDVMAEGRRLRAAMQEKC